MHNEGLQQHVQGRPVGDDVLEEVPQMVRRLVAAAQLAHGARDAAPLAAQLAREARAQHLQRCGQCTYF